MQRRPYDGPPKEALIDCLMESLLQIDEALYLVMHDPECRLVCPEPELRSLFSDIDRLLIRLCN